MAVFRVAFEHWIRDDSDREFAAFVQEGLAELRILAAG